MPTRLPLPSAFVPRTAEDLATLDERVGATTSMVIGPKVERTVRDANGNMVTVTRPAFIEWWMEYPAAFHPPGMPEPEAPADEEVRDFLSETAKLAAKAFVNQMKVAKARDAKFKEWKK